MRTSLAAVLLLCLISFSLVSVSAAEIEVRMSGDEAYVNKISEVSIVSDSTHNISGGSLTLNYDSNLLEIQDVSSENFDVKYECDNSALRAIFVLKTDECDSDELMKIRFIGKSEGVADIRLTLAELVDRELNVISADCKSDISFEIKDKDNSAVPQRGVLSADAVDEENIAGNDCYSVDNNKPDYNSKVLCAVGAFLLFSVLCVSVWRLFLREKQE